MWRCHCGEVNLDRADHCAACRGPRRTHEDPSGEPKIRERRKTVYVGFFGLGMGDDREDVEASRRALSEADLNRYYESAGRRTRLMWLVYVLLALAAVGILVWQVLRSD